MQLFYQKNIEGDPIVLDKEVAHHLVHVLRMNVGGIFQLTSGQSDLYIVEIIQADKKNVTVKINTTENIEIENDLPSIGIAFTKTAARMEWFLEKACEIGVKNIFPLLTKRSERTHFKMERFQNILVSAMCQSKRTVLPILHEPIFLQDCITQNSSAQILIAHCIEDDAYQKLDIILTETIPKSSLIFIGPEGDFTQEEVDLCLQNKAQQVNLGKARLRTETAGMVALTLLNQKL
jgi:16S rRNA (uracil1498-N3)-methyltransferase